MGDILEVSDIETAIEKNIYLKRSKPAQVAPWKTVLSLESRDDYLNRFRKPNNILLAGSPFQLKPRPIPVVSQTDSPQKQHDDDDQPSALSELLRGAGHNYIQDDPYASFFDDIKGWEEEDIGAKALSQQLASYQYVCSQPNDQASLETYLSPQSQILSSQLMGKKKRLKEKKPSSKLIMSTEEEADETNTESKVAPAQATPTRSSSFNNVNITRPKTAPNRQPFIIYSEPKPTHLQPEDSFSESLTVVPFQPLSSHISPFSETEAGPVGEESPRQFRDRVRGGISARIKQCKSASLKARVIPVQAAVDLKDGLGIITGKKYYPLASQTDTLNSPLKKSNDPKSVGERVPLKSILPLITAKPAPKNTSWIINGKSSLLHKSLSTPDDSTTTSVYGVPFTRSAKKLSAYGFQPSKVLMTVNLKQMQL